MKVACMALLMSCLAVHVYSQHINRPIDLPVYHDSLNAALDSLRVRWHFELTSNADDIRFSNVHLPRRAANLKDALQQLLRDLPLIIKIRGTNPVHVTLLRYASTTLQGRIFNAKGEGMEKLSVTVLHGAAGTSTSEDGYYRLDKVTGNDTLEISGANIHEYIRPEGRIRMDIQVKEVPDNLDPIIVSSGYYHDGYHDVKKALTPPGSWYQPDWSKSNLTVSSDVFSPLRGNTSGLLMGTGVNNSLRISLRGVSTLFANQTPLVVAGKFSFDGNINALNPYDIESVTALKDPVASLLWGARSGNGVLVYTPKTGTPNGKYPVLSVNINTIMTGKPDLRYNSGMDPASYITLEQQFFARHFYDGVLSDPNHPPVSPVVEVLDSLRRHLITEAKAEALINGYRQHDSRDDLRRWFYQTAVRQQYHLAITTGDSVRQHYLSAGYDLDPSNLRRNQFSRITVHDNYHETFGRLELSFELNFADIRTRNNNPGISRVNYPYASLDHPANYKYLSSYTDTAGEGRLLNWNYIPTQDLDLADNSSRTINYYGQADLRWHITPRLTGEGIYRYMNEQARTDNHYSRDGFYMRDLVNRFSDLSGPETIYPVPLGDLLASTSVATTARYFRGLLDFTSPASKKEAYSYDLQAGAESSEVVNYMESRTLYGYDNTHATGIPIDPDTYYRDFVTGDVRQIPFDQGNQYLYTRYLSFFADLRFNWKERFSFYTAAKKDATNIVGVNTNRKWAPFWATGIGYDASRRPIDPTDFPDQFKLRAGFGCNGNIGNRTGYLVTERLGVNEYGAAQSGIANPPDPSLTWEKTYMLNAGVDASFIRDRSSPAGRVQGSLDIYFKKGIGLLGNDSLPPDSGLNSFFGNAAKMRGQGIDLVLNTENIRGRFRWMTTVLLSYTADRVTKYPFSPASVAVYTTGNAPKAGYPANSLFSYRSAGLDPANGNPRGYLNNQVSEQYNDIVNGKDDNSIAYSGSYQPAVFGSLRNTFAYGKWTLSLLTDIKAFFFFRRTSINYYGVGALQDPGNNDFKDRWQKPGDEKRTTVPSLPDSVNDLARSNFYASSTPLITRGDCVRMQDIRLSCDIVRHASPRYHVRLITLYLYINQPFILWRANPYGIDPEAYAKGDQKPAVSYALGIHMEL